MTWFPIAVDRLKTSGREVTPGVFSGTPSKTVEITPSATAITSSP